MFLTLKRCLLFLPVLFVACGTSLAVAATGDPTVSASQRETLLVVRGTHFLPSAAVVVKATTSSGAGEVSVTASVTGSFSVAFHPPANFSGPISVSASAALDSAKTTFVFGNQGAASAAAGTSGEVVPTEDIAGWKLTYAEDFTKVAASAQFDSTYANSWCGYADGTGNKYFKSTVSAHDGLMDFALDGTKGAAGSFGPAATCWGKTYGRYSIRFKAEGAEGNGTAMMLWPSSDVWGDGEIDFPEGNFEGNLHVYHHPMNCSDCSSSDGADSGASFQQWHTATTEWTSSAVKYYVDGKLIKEVTHDVPTSAHRMTLQVAPNGPAQPGHLLVDWVAQWDAA